MSSNTIAVGHLKPHKIDGCIDLSSDHIVNACDELFVHITLLFNAILVHGALPDNFLRSTIVPTPKGRNIDGSNSNNYRGIALSSIFGKLMDNIVLIKFSNQLQTSSLQFGFKAKSSTNLCIFVLKETLAYYVKNQTTVFCTFLDASKAFDRINYCKLFRLLINGGMPAFVTRVLLNLYIGNVVRISWCGILSDYFLATNGVKQGGVLSPVFFCVYIDGLLTALASANVGCYIGRNYVGALHMQMIWS